MTKRVRIENADANAEHVIYVDVMQRTPSGDIRLETRELRNPTDMTEVYVHSMQYIWIREMAK